MAGLLSINDVQSYYAPIDVESSINQLQETSAVADFIQTEHAIAIWATSGTGPDSDHNLLLNTSVLLDPDTSDFSQVNHISFLTAATGATGATGSIWINNNGHLMNGNVDTQTVGSGDVVGPSSAVDNAVCRFDGTTGKLIQNSSVTVDDGGNLAINTAYRTLEMYYPTGADSYPILSIGQSTGTDFQENLTLGFNSGVDLSDNTLPEFGENIVLGHTNFLAPDGLDPTTYSIAQNVVIGSQNIVSISDELDDETGLYNNVVIGHNIMNEGIVNGAYDSVIIGTDAARKRTVTDANVIVGSGTCYDCVNTSLSTSTIIGTRALTKALTGANMFQNIVIGDDTWKCSGGLPAGNYIYNVIIGSQAGGNISNAGPGGSSNSNVAIGAFCMGQVGGGATNTVLDNVGIGGGCLNKIANGAIGNSCLGGLSCRDLTDGTYNTVLGYGSCAALTSGSHNNTVVGSSMGQPGTMTTSCCIGRNNPTNVTSATYDNILWIHNNADHTTESNVIRIGNSSQTKTFIEGIRGRTTVNADAIAVLIDSTGQLGTVSSSKKYKTNIESIDNSEIIYQMKPVKFNYIRDDGSIQEKTSIGLIAEEIEEVYPEMCIYQPNNEGKKELLTVDYNRLSILLLGEIQKLNTKVKYLEMCQRESKNVFI